MKDRQAAHARRVVVARLIAEAGPEGLAAWQLTEKLDASRDQINDDIAALRADGKVARAFAGGKSSLARFVAPQHIAQAMELARQRAAESAEQTKAALLERKRGEKLKMRILREAVRYGRELTDEERGRIKTIDRLEAAKLAREAALAKWAEPKHIIRREWPPMETPPGPRSVFDLA